MGNQFIVEINNLPEEVEDWVVARYSPQTRDLWYWGSWDDFGKALEVADEVRGKVVPKEEINVG